MEAETLIYILLTVIIGIASLFAVSLMWMAFNNPMYTFYVHLNNTDYGSLAFNNSAHQILRAGFTYWSYFPLIIVVIFIITFILGAVIYSLYIRPREEGPVE